MSELDPYYEFIGDEVPRLKLNVMELVGGLALTLLNLKIHSNFIESIGVGSVVVAWVDVTLQGLNTDHNR